MRSVRHLFLLAVLPLSVLAACGDDDTSSGDGGTPGESLVLYSGRDEALIQPIVDAFTEETGIAVDVRYGDSAEMGAQLLEEGDRTPADVFYSQEVGAIGVLAKADLLTALPQEVVDRVDERFQPDSGNEWVGVSGRSRVIAHNPDRLEDLGLDTPTTVLDLTDEQYAGEVAIIPGNAGFQAFVTGFRVSQGEEAARAWLEAMIANDAVTTIESNSDVLEAVNTGDVALGLINHYYWARSEDRESLTAQILFPEGDDPGALVNATAVGITVGGADNPDALALVEYLLSEDGQGAIVAETWEYPVVDGVADPDGIPALADLEGPALDLTDLDSLQQTQTLLTELGLLS